MNPYTSLRAALFTAAILSTQLTTQAVITAPYSPDAATLHLYHFDETNTPVIDYATAGAATNLTSLQNGATLGSVAAPGFGNALNTYDGGPASTAATGKDAVISCRGAGNAVTFSYADPTTGAFTFEALVRIDFDPAQSEAAAPAGTGRNAPMQIINCEAGGGNRIFQLRLDPVGLNPGATGAGYTNILTFPVLEFIKIGSPTEWIVTPIPTNGPDAIVSNNWYHVAVTYNGNPNTASNVNVYWTLLDTNRTSATLIGSWLLTNSLAPLSPTPTTFAIGNGGRSQNGNYVGLIDEVRISKVARGPYGMVFSLPSVVIGQQPVSQFAAAGDTVTLTSFASGGAPLYYQWQFNGTNLLGATNYNLVLTNITASQAGSYQVVVTNASSRATSDVAVIRVGSLAKNLFNTGLSAAGALLSGGDVDPHWQLVYSDDPLYPGPAAVVVGSPPASYLPNGPASMWLAPVASGSAAAGNFTYQTTFILDTLDPANTALTGGWAMDNQGMDIQLNGVSLGIGASGFGGLTPFTITNGFVLGLNTLACVIQNYASGGANPTGFRAELRAVGLPLPPTPAQFAVLPVNVTTQSQQTATFTAIAVGSGPLAYQWYQGPTLLTGQTNSTLVLANLTSGQSGTYTVVVTNSLSSTNASATLQVVTPPSLAWLGTDSTNPSWWDTVTVNWQNTSTSAHVAFASYNDVLFDDRGGASPNVDLIQPLTPNSVTVSANTTPYVLGSYTTATGSLTGPVVLTKRGTATFTLDAANNSTGPTLIQGGTLQVGNYDANGSLGAGPVTNNAALVFTRYDTFTVPNTISGTGTVTMAGSGTLALSGNNNYTGPTFINSGTISPRTSSALGSTNSSVTVAGGAQLYIFGDVNLAPVPLTLSGGGTGSGALRKASGAGTLFGGAITLAADAAIGADGSATFILTNSATITGTNANLDLISGTSGSGTAAGPIVLGTGMVSKDGAGTWMLTATNNSFSGGITVNAGTLQIGDGAADGSLGTGPLMINGGTLTFNTALPVNSTGEITDNSALTIAGTGSTLLSGNIHDNGTINITGPANVLLSGIIDGVGVLTNYSGTVTLTSSNFYVGTSGTVTLSAPNTYSGNTTIRGAGILRATASSALGTGTCFIGGAQTDTSRLELSGGIVLNNPISIFPRIFFGTASGTTDVAADILNVSGTNTLSPPSSIVIASGGNNLTLQSDSGDLILTTGVTGGGSGRHLVLRGAGSGEIQGALDRTGSNSQNVWKLDSGTWTLWGANSPGAATTISNGVLVLNGSLDNVLTNAGGTLAGTGVLSGPVYINAGATLAPGPSIATMTINNMLTLQPGSFTSMDVNKSTGASDRVVGLTNVTFGGTLVLNNLSGTLAAGDAFKLFDSTSYSGGFASISPFTPGAGLVWDTSTLAVDGTLRLKVGSVSQPTISSWAYTGSALVMSGSNGLPNASYSVVASTNVTAPLANWSVSGSGSFDASGNFSVTNPVSSSTPRMFFRLRVP